MFRLVETLYGLKIEPATAPAWHPDVRFYSIRDRAGALVGQFYVDLYARPSKRGGAWMDDAITRRRKDGRVQTPVAYLNCNFSAPVGGKPALFTHEEVNTLFHEFGHGLHHLLTRVDDLGVSGINGVEWDAVELPSPVHGEFLLGVGRARADDRARGHRRGRCRAPCSTRCSRPRISRAACRPCASSSSRCSTCACTHDFDPAGAKTALELLDEVRARVAVVFPPAYNRFPNNFSHIFAGGYAAGYYSYKWAEVLSADAYSLFEENGVLDPGHGAALLERDPRRGRQPPRARILRRLPRPRAEDRRAAAPQWNGGNIVTCAFAAVLTKCYIVAHESPAEVRS